MVTLAIDTSLTALAGVVTAAGETWQHSSAQPRAHAELLTTLIEQSLTDAGHTVAEVTEVVVGTGPALFTGLRVGIVSARVFALARQIPVRGVSSLAALAQQFYLDYDDDTPAPDVLVVTDARRSEVYWARYGWGESGLEVRQDPAVGPLSEAIESGTQGVVIGGEVPVLDRLAVHHPQLRVTAVEMSARALVAAAQRAVVGQGENLSTEPLYLRRPDAVPSVTRKRVS